LAVGLQVLGCSSTYWRNRGNDLADLIDLGITVSPLSKPGFALHADFFNITPLGYSHVDGQYIGWAYRQIGVLDFKDDAWGVLIYGREDTHLGMFDPLNPHQAPKSEIRQLQSARKPLPTEMAAYTVGIGGMAVAGTTPPWPTFFSCRKNIHLGWIGLWNVCRPVDLVDFILGWSTLDIVGDDAK
jgi:hypothetical protein